jgi:DNA-binding MarR family transcriptional regulator
VLLAVLCQGMAGASGDSTTWPEEVVVGPSVTIPTDPAVDAADAAEALYAQLADAGLRAVDLAQQLACTLRMPMGGCGGELDQPGAPVAPDVPVVELDPSLVEAPRMEPLPVPEHPLPGLGIGWDGAPSVSVDLAPAMDAASLGGQLPPTDGAPWNLAREAVGGASDAWPAATLDKLPATLQIQPVHIVNPVPEPDPGLPGTGLGLHNARSSAGAPAAPLALAAVDGAPGPAGMAPLAPVPSPIAGSAADLLFAPVAPAEVAPVQTAAPRAGAALPTPSGWEQAEAAARMVVGTSLLLPAWALYRRVRANMALDQPQRRDIYERVVAEPGMTPSDLRAATGLHYTTCVHHLRVLSQLGFVELRRVGGQVRCFENHRRYGEAESNALAAARSPTAGKLLKLTLEQPGITPAEAAKDLGITRSTVKHHVDRLAAWGVLSTQQDGPHIRLHVVPAAEGALRAALAVKPAEPPLVAAPGTAA